MNISLLKTILTCSKLEIALKPNLTRVNTFWLDFVSFSQRHSDSRSQLGVIEDSDCSKSARNELYGRFHPYTEGLSGFAALFLHQI